MAEDFITIKIGTGCYAEQKRGTIHDRRSESLVRAGGIKTRLWIRRIKVNRTRKWRGKAQNQCIAWFKHLQGVKYGQKIGI